VPHSSKSWVSVNSDGKSQSLKVTVVVSRQSQDSIFTIFVSSWNLGPWSLELEPILVLFLDHVWCTVSQLGASLSS